jgi:hypothetical protein
VPVLVCLAEEALGVLIPRSRAAAALFACLRDKGFASSSTACRLPRLPFSVIDQGNNIPCWEPPPNPSRLRLNLDASDPLIY